MVEVLLKDIGGQYGNMMFQNCNSGVIEDIEAWLANASSAGVIGANEILELDIESVSAASGADLERKALIYGVGETTGTRYHIVVPAPLFSGTLTDAGERISEATGQDVCDDWAAMTSEDITFTDGLIVEKE